jgi:hypothetical protein
MRTSPAHRFLIAAFLTLLAGVPLTDQFVDLRRGQEPRWIELFRHPPTSENLRDFERSLEEASVVSRAVRPAMRTALFTLFRDAGGKVLAGREGWLFYRPGIAATTQRRAAGETSVEEALAAVTDFRDQLAARGIRLLVVPVPNKERVHPERLSGGPGRLPAPADTAEFLKACRHLGVEYVDLSHVLASPLLDTPLYLARDTHWSPAGIRRAVAAVAERLGGAATGFAERDVTIEREGDLLRMLESPPLTRRLGTETVTCRQVVDVAGRVYADDPRSDVLVLGDSFLRIFQTDEPGGAGFIAHFAKLIGRPVTSIVSDGGASTLVRQELARRSELLANKKVVVWLFTERDLRLGLEGWQRIRLP